MCLSANKTNAFDEFTEARRLDKQPLVTNMEKENIFVSDFLALTTQYTRKSFHLIVAGSKKVKQSNSYKILTRTTQPAHVASILLVLTISLCLWPNPRSSDEHSRSSLTTFIYLGSFATHFGAQIWMTFISGLALYFSLPRHTFGMCQEILFPKYFLLNTLLSSLTLVSFAKLNGRFNEPQLIVQMIILSICLIIESIIYFYLTPTLLALMRTKYQFEQKLGNGQEIGYQQSVDGLRCPKYKQIHQGFRKVHMTCAIGNVIAICGSFAHLYYLASKITIH